MTNPNRGGPLAGVRVIELTKVWAGPEVGKILAYLGAEVIKIETMGSLDVTRIYGVEDMNKSPGFQSVNTQKLSVQINTKEPKGVQLLLDLLKESDMLIENLRPGAMQRMGLGWDVLKEANQGLIYVCMGMFGNDGPLAYQTGYAPCFNAIGGLSKMVGFEGESPAGMNMRYADSTFGAAATFAGLVALLHKQKTGKGQFIDVSACETMSTMIADSIMEYTLNGKTPVAHGNRHPEMAPHGVFKCLGADWMSIAIRSDAEWTALAELMEQPELASDPRFATLEARKENEDALEALLNAWTSERDPYTLTADLQAKGIAAVKSSNSADLVADADFWVRGFYQDITEPDGYSKPVTGKPWNLSRPAEVTDGAPHLGQHNAYVLGDILGLSEDEQKELAEAGINR